jgi:hypothetical protein
MTSDQANEPLKNKWQNRIEKRRNERGDVLGYVEQIIRDSKVPLDDVAAFLTPEELEETKYRIKHRAKEEAAARARMEADALARAIKYEENKRARAAFWKSNPPSRLTAVPKIETESAPFDALARYHIARVEYSFYIVEYHWERFLGIEQPDIEAWLPSEIAIDLRTELPDDAEEPDDDSKTADDTDELVEVPEDDTDEADDDEEWFDPSYAEGGRIGTAIYKAIKDFASDRAAVAADEGKIQSGKVIFDVRGRRIKLEATVEVTREEDFKKEWAPDAED